VQERLVKYLTTILRELD